MAGTCLATDFPLVEQGYDPSRVDEYLATQMLQLREELDAARIHMDDLEEQVATAKESEDALQLTMLMATRARNEMLEEAKNKADEIVGSARREAFSIMTDVRNDADGTIDSGRAIIAAAREEAMSIVTDVEQETERLIAERNANLARMQASYETESSTLIDRINTLRSIADDLAKKVGDEPIAAAEELPSTPIEGRTAKSAPQIQNVPDHEEDKGDTEVADRIRGSFSGRRSAKLPRIGEEAGRSALAAATAMRAHLVHEPDDSDTTDTPDLAARTA